MLSIRHLGQSNAGGGWICGHYDCHTSLASRPFKHPTRSVTDDLTIEFRNIDSIEFGYDRPWIGCNILHTLPEADETALIVLSSTRNRPAK